MTLAESDVLVIPKGARYVKEAFEFIRYVNKQGPMEKLCLGQRKFSPLAKVSDGFIQNHPNRYIRTFIELANSPNAHYVPRLSVWAEYNDEMNVAVDQVTALTDHPPGGARSRCNSGCSGDSTALCGVGMRSRTNA